MKYFYARRCGQMREKGASMRLRPVPKREGAFSHKNRVYRVLDLIKRQKVMTDQENVARFIMLRSQGWSLNRFVVELGVSMPTLGKNSPTASKMGPYYSPYR